MINGIIKLFYSEVVKTKMRAMSSESYELRDECKEIRNITLKIDSLFLKLLKIILGLTILVVAFEIKFILGIGVFLLEVAYIVYKRNMEKQIKESIYNIKSNAEISAINMISDKGKSGINVLMILLSIGIATSFNWIIVFSFVIVFMFTIKDIYSNIK